MIPVGSKSFTESPGTSELVQRIASRPVCSLSSVWSARVNDVCAALSQVCEELMFKKQN